MGGLLPPLHCVLLRLYVWYTFFLYIVYMTFITFMTFIVNFLADSSKISITNAFCHSTGQTK